MWLGFGFEDDEEEADDWLEAKHRMIRKRTKRNAGSAAAKKVSARARKKKATRSRRAKGTTVRATKRTRRVPRAARTKNSARRRPARRVTRKRNWSLFGKSDRTKVLGTLTTANTDQILARHIPQLRKQIREKLARAKKQKREVRGVDLDTAIHLKNRRRVAPAKDQSYLFGTGVPRRPRRANVIRRDRTAKRNAFGLDRFAARKPRKTYESWQFAGEKRRSRALRKAGVSKKLLPAYVNDDWKDLQQLDPGFVKKVMRSLNPSKLKKLRSAIGAKIRQLRAEGMQPKQAVAVALREARSGYLKPSFGRMQRRGGKRRNPDAEGIDRAGAKYAMFHGRGPSTVVTVEEMHPSDMAALGDLEALILGKKDYQIHWGKGERPMLAVDAGATQLYVVGGNQALPDSLLSDLGVSGKVDVVDLGEINLIEYFTQKDFDNFQPIVYYHEFGEEDAKKNPRKVRRPRLLYSRRYRKLMLAGGAYKIKHDGIIN